MPSRDGIFQLDAAVGDYLQTDHRQGYREAGRFLRRCLGQLEACQGIRPGVGQVCMPGRALKELPAYSRVPINHKTSPRGRIKLSVSAYSRHLLP